MCVQPMLLQQSREPCWSGHPALAQTKLVVQLRHSWTQSARSLEMLNHYFFFKEQRPSYCGQGHNDNPGAPATWEFWERRPRVTSGKGMPLLKYSSFSRGLKEGFGGHLSHSHHGPAAALSSSSQMSLWVPYLLRLAIGHFADSHNDGFKVAWDPCQASTQTCT